MNGAVTEATGENGLPCLDLSFGAASARLYLQGAHLTSWKPDGQREMLWLSQSSRFAPGQPIRGGIPICWPWFGGFYGEEDRPQHGFARTAEFELVDFEVTEVYTRARLRMISAAPYPEWHNRLALEVEIDLSDDLRIELITTNIADEPVEVGAALHSYFQVCDVTQVQIPALKGLSYKDKVRNFETLVQDDELAVVGETDRVFLNPPSEVQLLDPGAGEAIAIQSWGNTDLVVWNPWADNAQKLADFDDRGYRNMICIEPANALENRQRLQPGTSYRLGTRISLAP